MGVSFIYRGNTAGPCCKHLHRIELPTILDVFQANWRPIADPDESEAEVLRHGEATFGPGYICLHELAFQIVANDWPAPESLEELHARLEEMATQGLLQGLTLGPHHIQILDTDDLTEFALYIFDDWYQVDHAARVAFLLLTGWELPDGGRTGPFKSVIDCQRIPEGGTSDGSTFVVFLGVDDPDGLTNLGAGGNERCWRVDGVRLPDFPLFLLKRADLKAHEADPWELRALAEGLASFMEDLPGEERAFLQAARSATDGDLSWKGYSDWLVDQGRPHAGVVVSAELLRRCPPSRGRDGGKRPEDWVVAHAHVAQACKRLGKDRGREAFHHIVLFDDYWASAHPDLANSILRFGTRWDIL